MTRLLENVHSTVARSAGFLWALPAIALALPLSACGDNAEGNDNPDIDATAGDIDAAIEDPDAAALGCTVRILSPGELPRNQDWFNRGDSEANTTVGEDEIRMVSTGDELSMISFATGLAPTDAFEIEVRMKVNSVDPHTPFQGGAVLHYHYGSGPGLAGARGDMIYFDTDKVGFGNDDDGTFDVDTSVYNNYTLVFDGSGVTFSVNGTEVLTRAAVVIDNENIAIGDTTTSPALNSDIEIEYVNLCSGS